MTVSVTLTSLNGSYRLEQILDAPCPLPYALFTEYLAWYCLPYTPEASVVCVDLGDAGLARVSMFVNLLGSAASFADVYFHDNLYVTNDVQEVYAEGVTQTYFIIDVSGEPVKRCGFIPTFFPLGNPNYITKTTYARGSKAPGLYEWPGVAGTTRDGTTVGPVFEISEASEPAAIEWYFACNPLGSEIIEWHGWTDFPPSLICPQITPITAPGFAPSYIRKYVCGVVALEADTLNLQMVDIIAGLYFIGTDTGGRLDFVVNGISVGGYTYTTGAVNYLLGAINFSDGTRTATELMGNLASVYALTATLGIDAFTAVAPSAFPPATNVGTYLVKTVFYIDRPTAAPAGTPTGNHHTWSDLYFATHPGRYLG